jgi:hypothetical protein
MKWKDNAFNKLHSITISNDDETWDDKTDNREKESSWDSQQ